MKWKFWKRKQAEEAAVEMDFPTDTDNINAAGFAYQVVSEIDPMLLSNADQKRIRRIKRNCLAILDDGLKYVREVYEEDEGDDD